MIVAVAGAGHAAEVVGVVVASALAAVAMVAGSARVRSTAMLAAVVLAPVLLAADIWDSAQLRRVRDHPTASAVVGVVLLAAIVALARVASRRPSVVPVLAVAALPFRVPISAGGSTANLLVPLYGVVAVGVLAYAVPRLRGAPRAPAPPAGALEWLLGASIVLYAIASAWSSDFGKALQQVTFFYVPFALLFVVLREATWDRRLLRACLAVIVGLAVIFVIVGFVEYDRKELLLNPKVIAANQFQDYFRVNSLFFDPNIYGRFLAIVMLALSAVVLWTCRRRRQLGAAALLALLWAGLLLTLSQSSFAALLAGLAVLAALRWSARWTAAGVALLVGAAVAFVVLAPGALHLDLSTSAGADKATSGRVDLVRGGLRLFGSAPIVGHGAGSFSYEYRRRENASNERAVSASHTIPITVAAEEGVVGLAIYVALVVAALARLLRGARASPARAFLAAAFVGLLVHTFLYAAFLEDPITWTLLAIGAGLAPLSAGTAPAARAARRLRARRAAPAAAR